MKRIGWMILSVLAAGAASSWQGDSTLKAEIVIDAATGWPTSVQVGGSAAKDAWLGVSLYSATVVNPVTEGKHVAVPVKKGEFRMQFPVDSTFFGGSFEVASWEKRVDKTQCRLDYCHFCKTLGGHLEGLVQYRSGLLTRLAGY